jgi:hypothetical protein
MALLTGAHKAWAHSRECRRAWWRHMDGIRDRTATASPPPEQSGAPHMEVRVLDDPEGLETSADRTLQCHKVVTRLALGACP